MKILTIEGYHHGTYFCRANNMFGESEEYVNIMVKSKWGARNITFSTGFAVEITLYK